MKFLSLAIAALLTAPTAAAAKAISGKEFSSMLKSGKVNAQSLMKNATPLRKGMRKLEDAANDEEANDGSEYGYLGANGITGDHSIKFNKCISVTVEEDWSNDENIDTIGEYVLDEKIKSVRSYILFNVCKTKSDCYAGEDDVENTYMVDLPTFVSAMLNYLPDQKDSYCTGCEYQYKYCQAYGATAASMGIDYSSSFFFYNDVKYQLIDCDLCDSLGCFADEDTYEQNDWDSVAEWLASLGECYDTGSTWNNLELYAGLICNEDGSGVEIGVFNDEDCTVYNSMKSYTKLIEDGSSTWEYYEKSTGIMSYIFTESQFDCYGGDINYISLMQTVYTDNNDGDWDPCAMDGYGYYLDENECMKMMQENPCYAEQMGSSQKYYSYYYNTDDYDGEAACAEYMEENPCWAMPGEDVSEDYYEACQEYKASFAHETNNACTALFYGDGDGDGDTLTTPLSSCTTYSASDNANAFANATNEEGEGQQNEEDNQGVSYPYNATDYDISYEEANDFDAFCYHIEQMYINGELSSNLFKNAYDSTSSGSLYDYSREGSGHGGSGGSYFPTIPNVITHPSKLAPGEIVAIAFAVASVVFLGLFWCQRRRSNQISGAKWEEAKKPILVK